MNNMQKFFGGDRPRFLLTIECEPQKYSSEVQVEIVGVFSELNRALAAAEHKVLPDHRYSLCLYSLSKRGTVVREVNLKIGEDV